MNETNYVPKKYRGNGSTTNFSFNWKVMNIDELVVELEEIATGTITKLIRGSNYSATINAVGGNVVLISAPTNAYNVVLRRETSCFQTTGYSTSTGFQGAELEKSFDRYSCVMQDMEYNIEKFKEDFSNEVDDTITEFEDEVNDSIDVIDGKVDDAGTSANSAIEKANQAISTANTASTNASTAVTTANTAKNTADTALEKANLAITTSNTASTNASTAVTTANTAKNTADTALEKANLAITTSNTASTNASTAVTTANTANTNASSALEKANQAISTANTASTNASNAVTTANSASSTATTAKNTADAASAKVDEFGVDIATVIAAAAAIGDLDEKVATATGAATTATNASSTATTAATTATNKAQLASDKADIATQKAQEAIDAVASVEQSDWNQSDNTKKDYIKNKPTIPDAQIQSDWDQTDTDSKDYIKNKPTIPTVPTALSSFTDDLGSSPVHTHSQYVTDISGKEDILKTVNVLDTSGTVTLTDNSINTITPSGNVTFTLPTVSDNTKFHQILVQINLSTLYTLTLGTTYYFNKTAPDLSQTGVYNLYFEYDKANQYWVVGLLPKGASS